MTSEEEIIVAEQRGRLVTRLRMISKDAEGAAKAMEDCQHKYAAMLVGQVRSDMVIVTREIKGFQVESERDG